MSSKILVIEDEAFVRGNVREILELNGYSVVTANDGRAGVRSALTERPDLILCDVMMPEMTGYEVLNSLQNTSNAHYIPFIFLSAKAERGQIREGMNLGADDYLTKPFTSEDLLAAVQTRLTQKDRHQAQAIEQIHRNQTLTQELHKTRLKTEEVKQLADLKDELLSKISADLREPLSNINVAIHMLQKASTPEERDRYIRILKEEYAREMNLLNQVDNLRSLLTPDNAKLLQTFNLLQKAN
jgi:two-component system, OmpR family, alkaline phosphatase synthesis response regulator PhoP